jgi:aminodeoxychorismate synthase component I
MEERSEAKEVQARHLRIDFDGRTLEAHEPLGTLEMWPSNLSAPKAWLLRWTPDRLAAGGFSAPFERPASDAWSFIAAARDLHSCLSSFPHGGAVGFLAYDWARSLEPRAFKTTLPPGASTWPLARLTFCARLEASQHAGLDQRLADGSGWRGDFVAPVMEKQYALQVERVRAYIESGDIYQANLTRSFTAPLLAPPEELYQSLRRSHPMPFGAFLEWSDGAVVSNSPERFVRLRGRELLAQPIKGTARHETDEARDARAREALRGSAKDKAENVMIVDLLRNDLGRVCEWGSVRVPSLWKVESFPTLHHLVSSVEGTLRPELDGWDALATLFPCGSITGAPKIRAMQVIDEMESAPRGVAMGALGYWRSNGDMDWNVAIRTVTCRSGRALFHAGGGIVWDSNPEDEWREMHLKASALQRALASG